MVSCSEKVFLLASAVPVAHTHSLDGKENTDQLSLGTFSLADEFQQKSHFLHFLSQLFHSHQVRPHSLRFAATFALGNFKKTTALCSLNEFRKSDRQWHSICLFTTVRNYSTNMIIHQRLSAAHQSNLWPPQQSLGHLNLNQALKAVTYQNAHGIPRSCIQYSANFNRPKRLLKAENLITKAIITIRYL